MPEFRILLTIVALLAAMTLAAAIGLTQRAGALMLALLSFVWLTVDRDFEGPKLLSLTHTNAVVTGDLVGLLGFVVAVALWWRQRRR